MEIEEEFKPKERKILVAVNTSEQSMYALRWAVDHLIVQDACNHDRNDKVILMYAQPPSMIYADNLGIMESLETCQTSTAPTLLAKAKGICSNKKLERKLKWWSEIRGDAICEQVMKLEADILVMGSRGKGLIERALLGSISDYCTCNANCPVLIVKQPKK